MEPMAELAGARRLRRPPPPPPPAASSARSHFELISAAFHEGTEVMMADNYGVPPIIYVEPSLDLSTLHSALRGVEHAIIYMSPNLAGRTPWPTRFEGLPPELIHAIATELGTAAGRAAMAAVCRSWRDATARSDALWRTIALKRYPRLAGIARVLGGRVSWLELYKAHVRVEAPKPPATPLSLDSFVMSIELYEPPPAACGGAEDTVTHFAWTGTLSDVAEGECYPFADFPPPKWSPGTDVAWEDEEAVESWWRAHQPCIEALHMRVHLSRSDDPVGVQSILLCALPFGTFDTDELVWDGRVAYREGLFDMLSEGSLEGMSSSPNRWLYGIELRFDPFEGKLEMNLRDRHLERLGKPQLLNYALDAVPWK